jgi:hypothetical protein
MQAGGATRAGAEASIAMMKDDRDRGPVMTRLADREQVSTGARPRRDAADAAVRETEARALLEGLMADG